MAGGGGIRPSRSSLKQRRRECSTRSLRTHRRGLWRCVWSIRRVARFLWERWSAPVVGPGDGEAGREPERALGRGAVRCDDLAFQRGTAGVRRQRPHGASLAGPGWRVAPHPHHRYGTSEMPSLLARWPMAGISGGRRPAAVLEHRDGRTAGELLRAREHGVRTRVVSCGPPTRFRQLRSHDQVVVGGVGACG